MKKLHSGTKKLVALLIVTAMLGMFAPTGFFTGTEVFAAARVTSISVKTKPTKLKYKVGDKLATKGLKLTVKYSNNTKRTVSSGFTCTPTKLSKAGTQKITVKYKGKKTSFSVTVAKVVKSIKIKSKPAKLKYNTGETLNTSGLKLTVTYTDKTTKTITSGFTCTPTKFTKTGTQKVTVKYGGKTASFDVTVKKAASLPKLTNANVADVLEQQLTCFAGCMNGFAGKLDENASFYGEGEEEDFAFYRSVNFKSKKELTNHVLNNLLLDEKNIPEIYNMREVDNALYIGLLPTDFSTYALGSTEVKEYLNGIYYITIDGYSLDEYDSTIILQVLPSGGRYLKSTTTYSLWNSTCLCRRT